MIRLVGTVLLTSMLILPVSSAGARGRAVPRGFFGTVLNPQILVPASGPLPSSVLGGQLGNMARSGVESLRVTFAWSSIEPSPGTFNWTVTDGLVAAAAQHGVSLLADAIYSPKWASANPLSFQSGFYGPKNPQTYADFMTALVARYGPHGAFWAANPGLPKVPIRNWQIWNEQAANFFWVQQPWPTTYTATLRAAYAAIHRADRGATVVAGSLVGVGNDTPWSEMKALYAAGAKRYFDEISVHPFTIDPRSVRNTVDRVIKIIRLVRGQMHRHGDAHKPIVITEMSFPAALGRVPTSRLLGLETTSSGESRRLTAAYTTLGREHAKLGLKQVYWFTWASSFDARDPLSDVSYQFAGLTKFAAPARFTPEPALNAYSRVARQLEGCRKSTNALHCG